MEITTGVSISRRMVIITITIPDIGTKAMAFAFGSTLDNYQRKTASSKKLPALNGEPSYKQGRLSTNEWTFKMSEEKTIDFSVYEQKDVKIELKEGQTVQGRAFSITGESLMLLSGEASLGGSIAQMLLGTIKSIKEVK